MSADLSAALGRSEAVAWIGAALAPEPAFEIVEWCQRHRRIEAETPAPGPWSPEIAPYVVEPLRALFEPGVKVVVVVAAAQSGKTENVVYNWDFYALANRLDPVMFLLPDEGVIKKQQARLLPSVQACAPLWDRVAGRKRALKAESWDFGSNRLTWANAQSPTQTVSSPICYLICDEVDLMAPSALARAEKRTQAFSHKAKIGKTSTPTTEDGPVWRAFQNSSAAEWHVPCLGCGEPFAPRWEHVHWETREEVARKLGLPEVPPPERFATLVSDGKADIWIACPICGHKHRDRDKQRMNAGGLYVSAHPELETVRGYRFSALTSRLTTLRNCVAQWYNAQGDSEALKEFHNQVLAEPWKQETLRAEEAQVLARSEGRSAPALVPAGTKLLTLGSDVQGDRIPWELWAWGDGWGHMVDHGTLWGEPSTALPGLEPLIRNPWAGADGGAFRVGFGFVDSGYESATVYNWLWSLGGRLPVVAAKGQGSQARSLFVPGKAMVHGRGEIPLVTFHADTIKTNLANLFRAEPGVSFHREIDHKFAREFVSESRVKQKDAKGFARWVWAKRPGYDDNHFWDCAVGALAAKLFYMGEGARDREAQPPPSQPAPPKAPAPQPRPKAPRRPDRLSKRGGGLF